MPAASSVARSDDEDDDVERVQDETLSSAVISRGVSVESMASTSGDGGTDVQPSKCKKTKRGPPPTDVSKILTDFLSSSKDEGKDILKAVSRCNVDVMYNDVSMYIHYYKFAWDIYNLYYFTVSGAVVV